MKMLPFLVLVAGCLAAQAKLIVKVDEPKTTGSKTVVKVTMKNSFSQKVESARASLFLLDDSGKIVGRSTQWVIGGAKDKAPLKLTLPLHLTSFSTVGSPLCRAA